MTEMPSAYQGTVLSARSRRLRTIGILLLVAVIGMTIYGMTALMPPINRAAARVAQQESIAVRATSQASGLQQAAHHTAARKNLRIQVAVAYAYWGVCALLLIAVLFVAWLDLREISRNYVNQRRAIWTDATTRDMLARGPTSEE